MVVIVQREGTEDIVIFVDGLAIVPSVLLVPVFTVRVAVSALLGGRVDEATILGLLASAITAPRPRQPRGG